MSSIARFDSMSSIPIKVGFVGLSATGWAAMALGPSLLQPVLHDRYTLTAVSTSSEQSATASAKKYTEELGHPVKAYYGDSAKIAADPDIDLVVVAVKAPLHKSVVLPVIEAKKDFFIEWPAGTGLKDTIEIAEAARKHGVRGIVGLQSGRQGTFVKKVKEIIASGKIGTVRSTSMIASVPMEWKSWGPRVAASNIYALDKANGATILTIPIAHHLDTLTHILGDLATVNATAATVYPVATVVDKDDKPTGETANATSPDHFAITGMLKSGAILSMMWRGGYPATKGRRQFVWEIDGDEGSIRLESDSMVGAASNPDVYLNGELVTVEGGGLITHLTSAWIEFAKGEKGEYATIDDAVKHHILLAAIEKSIEEQKTIVL